MKIQSSIEFLLIGSAIAAMCLFVVSFYSKNLFSQTSALAAIANVSPNSTYYQPPAFFSYSASTTSATASYSASITGRRERLAYVIGQPSYVVNMSEFNHCTQVGFFGHPFNVSGQCGTSNAWDYLAGYACFTGGAYCIVPRNTTYATESLSGKRSYVYNFTLEISSPSGQLVSRISSSANGSPVTLGTQVIGHADVESVGSPEPYLSATLMSHLGEYAIANRTYYSIYSQDRNSLYPMLAYYNGTSVDSATQQSIEQSVGAFASAQLRLLSSSTSQAACTVSDGSYICNASVPLLYLINVTLSPGFGSVNQTIYYLGSVINVGNGA